MQLIEGATITAVGWREGSSKPFTCKIACADAVRAAAAARAAAAWTSSSYWFVALTTTGGTLNGLRQQCYTTWTGSLSSAFSGTMFMAAGDTAKFTVSHNQGGTVNTSTSYNYANFSIDRIA